MATNSYSQSWGPPAEKWTRTDSIGNAIYEFAKWFKPRVPKDDLKLHTQAALHALDNLENGEVARWYNAQTDSYGEVRVILTWSNHGTICRRIYSYVTTSKKQLNFEDSACFDHNYEYWRFVDKY